LLGVEFLLLISILLQSGHAERSAGVAALESRIRELEADTSQLDTLRHTAQLFTQLQVRKSGIQPTQINADPCGSGY
jgi:hypothetical protein